MTRRRNVLVALVVLVVVVVACGVGIWNRRVAEARAGIDVGSLVGTHCTKPSRGRIGHFAVTLHVRPGRGCHLVVNVSRTARHDYRLQEIRYPGFGPRGRGNIAVVSLTWHGHRYRPEPGKVDAVFRVDPALTPDFDEADALVVYRQEDCHPSGVGTVERLPVVRVHVLGRTVSRTGPLVSAREEHGAVAGCPSR